MWTASRPDKGSDDGLVRFLHPLPLPLPSPSTPNGAATDVRLVLAPVPTGLVITDLPQRRVLSREKVLVGESGSASQVQSTVNPISVQRARGVLGSGGALGGRGGGFRRTLQGKYFERSRMRCFSPSSLYSVSILYSPIPSASPNIQRSRLEQPKHGLPSPPNFISPTSELSNSIPPRPFSDAS